MMPHVWNVRTAPSAPETLATAHLDAHPIRGHFQYPPSCIGNAQPGSIGHHQQGTGARVGRHSEQAAYFFPR